MCEDGSRDEYLLERVESIMTEVLWDAWDMNNFYFLFLLFYFLFLFILNDEEARDIAVT